MLVNTLNQIQLLIKEIKNCIVTTTDDINGNYIKSLPATIPIVKQRKVTLGAITLRRSPKLASNEPVMVIALHPYLLVSPLARGPTKIKHE